jgi:hypothetical protein
MIWHLVDPSGAIVRSVEADVQPQARFRLAPVPPGHLVVAAANYTIPTTPAAPVPTRVGRGDWYGNATTQSQRNAIRAKLSDAVKKGMAAMPEDAERRRRERIARWMRDYRSKAGRTRQAQLRTRHHHTSEER